MNYKQSLEYLETIREQGAKLELQPIQRIIDHLPTRLTSRLFVQVAGTNGKGSTSHFITSILQHAGFKTGLFTSPHLEDIRERITVNKNWITKSEFADAMTTVRSICDKLLNQGVLESPPTFFEHLFLASLTHFDARGADAAVFEVGLGGRLDATSTLSHGVTVITNISYDHTKTLGSRLRDIAFEKAGVIKPSTPVVCGCPPRTISHRIIRKISLERKAPYNPVLDGSHTLSVNRSNGSYRATYTTPEDAYDFTVMLNGEHQTRNAATAIKTAEILRDMGVRIPRTAVLDGVRNNFVPGRIEILPTRPSTIIDCSHNVESVAALSDFLKEKNYRSLTLVFGVLRDKKYRKMLSLLKPFIAEFVFTEPISNRRLPAEKLAAIFPDSRYRIEKNLVKAYAEASRLGGEVLITGSLYLAGEMRKIITGGMNNG